MQCPHNIEPHQIQGLDFISIFPVTQWLVKKSVESREERAESHRAFAISQFDKTFCLKSDIDNRNKICLLEDKIKQIIVCMILYVVCTRECNTDKSYK